jgi:hypothetical protein
MVGKQTDAKTKREWSSIRLRISTSVPSARSQWVASACHISLGSSASKRLNEDRGRLWGSGMIRPWRLRIRQMVAGEGTLSTRPTRW